MVTIEQMTETYKLLADNTRLTILALLKEKELCVCDIVDILETSQPNVSQHLRKLKAGGLVHEKKRSQWVYYSINISDNPCLQSALQHVPSQKHRIDKLQELNTNCCKV